MHGQLHIPVNVIPFFMVYDKIERKIKIERKLEWEDHLVHDKDSLNDQSNKDDNNITNQSNKNNYDMENINIFGVDESILDNYELDLDKQFNLPSAKANNRNTLTLPIEIALCSLALIIFIGHTLLKIRINYNK